MKNLLRIVFIVFTLTILNHPLAVAFAQGTAFNYQGHLNAGGVAANGSYDLQFTLYTINAGGIALAGPVTNSATAVSNGLFTTAIDFGPGVFVGESNWLEIAVRTNNGGSFTELSPRQQINPTPYAIYAEGAASAGSVAANNISGMVQLAQLPTVLVTNSATGVALSGTFVGAFGGSFFGAGNNLSNLNPTNLNPGTAAINISGNAATATTVAGLSNYWSLNGNNVGSGQFLGSTNDQALELHVDGERALQLIPDANNEGAPDFIAGSVGNYVAPGVVGAVVDGGATNYTGNNLFEFAEIDYTNSVLSDFSVVAGGVFNTAGGGGTGGETVSGGANNTAVNSYATVGGGENNNAVGLWSAIGGGNNNNADGSFYGATVVAGGSFNTAGADYATVGGGSANQALAYYSTVPGGDNNLASGEYSFAAGNQAQATNRGAFVWADSQSAAFTSTNNDSFNVRAQGGVQLVTSGAGLTVDGQRVFAGSNGGGLTNLSASQLIGTIPLAQLPLVVVTNGEAGVSLTVSNLSVTTANQIAPLTISPNSPSGAVGAVSKGSGSHPESLVIAGRYAYLANAGTSKLQIIDVSSPTNPVSVGSVGLSFIPSSAVVAGRYAYVSGGGDLQIFDVSDPANPVGMGLLSTGNLNGSIAIAGRYVYMLFTYAGTMQVIDVGNPSNPVGVGSISIGASAQPDSVAVAGRYAYVANNGSNTLQIIDVSNPANPVSAGIAATTGSPLSVAVSGRYAYVVNGGGNNLQIFDVSNPANPVNVGTAGTASGPQSITVAGRYACVAASSATGTLQIFDVSNPANPVSVGMTGMSGNTPAAVAVSGRYAYTADPFGSEDLQIFDLGGEYVQQLEAGAVEVGSLQTRDTATVGNNLNVRGGLTVSGSARISGGLSVDNGGITATNFTGNGGGLTNLNPASLSAGTAGINISGNAQTATLANNVVLGINITNAFITGAVLTNTTLNFPSTMTINSGGMPIWYSDSQQNMILGTYGNYFSTLTSGSGNTSLGTYALEIISTGSGNTGIGWSALYSVNKGSYNSALGYEAFNNLMTGSNNIAVGYQAGFGLMGNESNNIDIGNYGNPGENNTIRIGTNGVQTAAYIAGVINGNGGGLTNLNAAKLAGTLPGISGASLINLNPTSLSAGTAGINISGNAQTATTATLADNVVLGIGITNAFITGATLTNATLNFPSTMTINSGGMPIWYSDSAQNLILGEYGNYSSEIGQGAAANTSLGTYALEIISSGVGNTGIGDSALYSVNKGNYNTALGYEAFNNLMTGSNNIAVGYQAGFGLMGNESNNIDIGNYGNPGENNTIRIGTNGVQTAAYIAGVINGNGSGLTNLNASKLAGGTIPTSVLSGFQGPTYETISGGSGNVANGTNTVIGGGVNNIVGYAFSTVGGGTNNDATGEFSTIGGGENNLANNFDDTVAGGQNNSATGGHSFVGGGQENVANYLGATVSGGLTNSATYLYATVPGGYFNIAGGQSSFAAGQFARATNNNTFVWGDGSVTVGSLTNNSVTMLATNGYRFFTGTGGSVVFTNVNSSGSDQQVAWTPGSGSWAFTSDRNTKDRFEAVDPESVLARVMELPVSEWSYKGFDQRHIGVMAQDFHAQFPLNGNDKALNDADLHGVELAAIQGLNQKLNEKDAEIANLEARLDKLELLFSQKNKNGQ